jgi:transposase
MRPRRRFTAEFKAKVALEAIQGHRTVAELATNTNCTRPRLRRRSARQLRSWPRCSTTRGPRFKPTATPRFTKLHAKIGQLVVERDFLANDFDP